MDHTEHIRYRFADVLIDVDQHRLVRGGREVNVQPRVFDLLIYLIDRHDRAVSKDELQDAIWPGMVVTETALSRAIMKARKAVGDDAQRQFAIKTLHSHGYRFVAPLISDPPEGDQTPGSPGSVRPATDQPEKRRRRQAKKTLAVLTLLALTITAYLIGYRPLEMDVPTLLPSGEGTPIAVLPFTNLSEDKDSEYFSDGLSEEIMNRLSRVSGLLVVARTSAFTFKGTNKDSRTIANELRVSHLIDGSVRRDGDRLRIHAQLLDSNGFQRWSKTYDGVLVDVFSLQDAIANDIAGQIRPSLAGDSNVDVIRTRPPTQDLEAYELVLRGNFHLQRRNEGPLKRSMGLFRKAIARDENYGDAWVGLATAHALLPFYSYAPPEDEFALAMATIEQGTERDETVGDKASAIKAFILYNSDWRWIDAENEFQRALDYTPDNAEVQQWYSLFLGSAGRFEDSLRVARRAQQLDPLSPVVNHRLAIAHLWANNDDEALRYFERAGELGMPAHSIPGAYIILSLRLGEPQKAREVMTGVQELLGLDSEWLEPVFQALSDPSQVGAAAEAVAKAEEKGEVARLYSYGVWTYLGQADRAIDAAFKLVNDRPAFNSEFLFSRESAVLRANARFGDLVEAIRLPEYWEEFGWPDVCQPQGESFVCK